METGARDDFDHDKRGETESSESEGLEKTVKKLEGDHICLEVFMECRQTLGSDLGSLLRPWEDKAKPAARTGVTTRYRARASNKDDNAATRAPLKGTKDSNAAARTPPKAFEFAIAHV